jgi:hypothetical protein
MAIRNNALPAPAPEVLHADHQPAHARLDSVLSTLDLHQRRELEALAACAGKDAITHRREGKRELYAAARFFIEHTWEHLAPRLEEFSLEAESGKSTPDLHEYLRELQARQPAFAWGWMRSKMNAALMRCIEDSLPGLLAQHPEAAVHYQECLSHVDHYWFRQTPMHHLKAGYHTALSVACKWYGSAFELWCASADASTHPALRKELRMFASFSMTMLARTDGWLWDSAGAEPMDVIVEDGRLKVATRQLEELNLVHAPDYGVRLGCPALRARREQGPPPFDGIVQWVEEVFERYLLR